MTHKASPGLVHLALAVGGFAIGTTEFAAMGLEPDLARGLGVDAPTVGGSVAISPVRNRRVSDTAGRSVHNLA